MSDLREKAARATHDYYERHRLQIPERMTPPRPWEDLDPGSQRMTLEAATVVVDAIESDIRADERAKVFDELKESVERDTSNDQIEWYAGVAFGEPFTEYGSVSDYIAWRKSIKP